MPAPFNETNVTTIAEVMQYANDVTGPAGSHYYGDAFVLAVWIVFFALVQGHLQKHPFKAIMVSSFMAFLVAVILDILQLIDTWLLTLPIALFTISVVADILGGEE